MLKVNKAYIFSLLLLLFVHIHVALINELEQCNFKEAAIVLYRVPISFVLILLLWNIEKKILQ